MLSIPEKIFKKGKVTWITPKNIEYNTRIVKCGKSSGKYIVQVEMDDKVIKDSTIVIFVKKPVFNIPDTIICKGNELKLNLKNTNYSYLWSNSSKSPIATFSNAGRYWVTINNKGCFYTDTFRIKTIEGIEPGFGKEQTFCLNEEDKSLSVKAPPGTLIEWSTGDRTFSTTVSKEGTYWVKTTNKSCGTRTDSILVKLKACNCEILIPNSFTPNEDNKNDYFFPVLQCEYSYFSFTVFDKWGNQVFTTNSVNGKWDGRFKGHLCDEDIYVYKIETIEKGSEKKNTRSGKVSLIR